MQFEWNLTGLITGSRGDTCDHWSLLFHLGLTDDRKGNIRLANDNKPFTTLTYANGPGSYSNIDPGLRPNITNIKTGIQISNIMKIIFNMETVWISRRSWRRNPTIEEG